MRIAELVLKYVQALVWPATALAITFLFRQQLRQILLRLTRVEAAGASMEFAAETELLSRQAEVVEASLPMPDEGPGPTGADVEEPYGWRTYEDQPWYARLEWIRAIMHLTPSGAVSLAREELVKELERTTGLVFAYASQVAMRDALRTAGLGPEAILLYQRFMRLADTARPGEITELSAIDLIDTAGILLRALSDAPNPKAPAR